MSSNHLKWCNTHFGVAGSINKPTLSHFSANVTGAKLFNFSTIVASVDIVTILSDFAIRWLNKRLDFVSIYTDDTISAVVSSALYLSLRICLQIENVRLCLISKKKAKNKKFEMSKIMHTNETKENESQNKTDDDRKKRRNTICTLCNWIGLGNAVGTIIIGFVCE